MLMNQRNFQQVMAGNDRKIKFVSWNARSLRNKNIELIDFLNTNKPHFVNISETHFNNKDKFTVPGYTIYRKDKEGDGGGVLIMVKSGISHTLRIINNLNHIEAIGVEVSINNINTTIISVYVPQNKLLPDDLNKLLRLNNHVIISGDMNSRHRQWNCHSNNKNGKTLLNYISRHNVDLHAPSSPTH